MMQSGYPILHWRNLLQVLITLIFVLFVGLPGFERLHPGVDQDNLPKVLTYVAIWLICAALLNAWIRYFQKVHNRSVSDTRVRSLFSLYVSVPVAYLVYVLLPEVYFDFQLFWMSLLTALFAVVYHHVTNAYVRAKATVLHRILASSLGPTPSL